MGKKKTDISKSDYTILKKVADDNVFSLEELMLVYSKESDSGSNLHRKGSQYKGPFQFGKASGKDAGLVGKGFDYRNDLAKSAQGYVTMVGKNRKALSHYLTKYGINDTELLKFDKSTINYMLHQQSGRGLASILKTIDSPITTEMPLGSYRVLDVHHGSLNPRARMLENLTDDQKKHFKYKTENIPEASRYFLDSVKEQLKDIQPHIKKNLDLNSDTSFLFPDRGLMPGDIPV